MNNGAGESLIAVSAGNGTAGANHHFVHAVSPAMLGLERALADIADTDIPVLLVGESGTGKEVIALEIHRLSRRSDQPFVKCVCAGLTPESITARFAGEYGNANSGMEGSVFLDEIAQLDLASQSCLLNLLPDGSRAAESGWNARLICCTTRNLEEEMRRGRFREELYYRVNGVFLRLPPLRERAEDIPVLLDFFLQKYAGLFGRSVPHLSDATLRLLASHCWPGNVRELENVARKIVALGDEHVALADLARPNGTRDAAVPSTRSNGRSLKEAARQASREAERILILQELERTHWNRKKTARELQISYKALLYKLKQLGLGGNGEGDQGGKL